MILLQNIHPCCEDCGRALDMTTYMESQTGTAVCRHCHDKQAAAMMSSICGDSSDVSSIKPSN